MKDPTGIMIRIHILGSYANIAIARNAICNLIMGSPPNKVYNQMKQVGARKRDRFLSFMFYLIVWMFVWNDDKKKKR